MELHLKLEGEELQNTYLELLMRLAAEQRAANAVMIEMMAKNAEDEKIFKDRLHDATNFFLRQVFEELYAQRSSVNIDDILKKKDSPSKE